MALPSGQQQPAADRQTSQIRNAIYPQRFSRDSRPRDNPILLSENAIKFGEKNARAPRFVPSGRSALTPTLLYESPQAFPRTKQEYEEYRQLADHQKERLEGFTADELEDLFARENPDATPSTLHEVRASRSGFDISISPVLQKNNWRICIPSIAPMFQGSVYANTYFRNVDELKLRPEMLAARPRIEGTDEGFLDFACPAVWEAILPAIRLASRVLQNMHGSIFYDTLFNGERRRIDPARKPAGTTGELWSIWPRDSTPTIRSAQNDWVKFSKSVHLFISPDEKLDAHGVTFSDFDDEIGSHIGIEYRLIIPLLSNRLTESERHINSFFLAVTILHELAHAVIIWRAKTDAAERDEAYKFSSTEPFFRDEYVSEVGWSGENALWGGEVCIRAPSGNVAYNAPALMIGKRSFPSRDSHNIEHYSPSVVLDNVWAEPGTFQTTRRVFRLDFLQDIQTPEFWDLVVAKYGIDMLRTNASPYFHVDTKDWLGLNDPSGSEPLVRSVRRGSKSTKSLMDYESLMKNENDPWWRLKDRRYRRTKSIITKFETRKNNEYRAWRRWGDRYDPRSYGSARWGIPQHLRFDLDSIIREIAISMGISTYQLRKRPRKFIEGLVGQWLEAHGIPRDEFFNFEEENVLLTEGERDAGSMAIDLDEIVEAVLVEESLRGNDLMPAIHIAQDGGDRHGLNVLADLVRNWLQGTLHEDRDYFDEEMIRRSKDPEEIFYIKPVMREFYERTLEMLRANGWPNNRGFDLAEHVRDCLQADGYARDALDGPMGPDVSVIPIEYLDVERQQFIQYLNSPLDAVMNMQNREKVLGLWREWLVARRYSTATVLFE